MELIGVTFPMLIVILPKRFDAAGVQAMAEGYESYHARAQHFAVVSILPKGASTPSATERKLVTDWADSPRVRDMSKRFCVMSAVVLPNPLMRGVLTAMHWVMKPICPTLPVSTAREGINVCLERLVQAGVSLPRSVDTLRNEATAMLAARNDIADS